MRLLVTTLLLGSLLWGCEADGLLWMPPTNKADALYRVIVHDRAGFIDRHGRMMIAPTLPVGSNWGQFFYNGFLSLGIGSGPFLNTHGETVLDNHFYRIWDFSENLAAAAQTSDSLWGYIDPAGRFRIPPQFPSFPQGRVSNFSEGLAAVEVGGKLGYINPEGKFTISPHLAAGTAFENGTARVVWQGPCYYQDYESVDPCLRLSPRQAPATIQPGQKPARETTGSVCRWTFIDRTGQRVMRAEFEAALGFHEGLAAVKIKTGWGFIDETGQLRIAPQFHSVHSFSEGLALVDTGTRSGYIDKTGTFRMTVPAGQVGEDFSDHLAVQGNLEGGYIYINQKGQQAIPGRFVLASHFLQGIAHVKVTGLAYGGGTFAYIDTQGHRVYTYSRNP